ncbi:hypothetical protein [Fuchsiella alkaliacetigena]|nr:hypothetical protein [Fuchsiella alkaliacetigena]
MKLSKNIVVRVSPQTKKKLLDEIPENENISTVVRDLVLNYIND